MRKGDVDSLDAALPHIFIFSKERRSFFSTLTYAGEKGGFLKYVNFLQYFCRSLLTTYRGRPFDELRAGKTQKRQTKKPSGTDWFGN